MVNIFSPKVRSEPSKLETTQDYMTKRFSKVNYGEWGINQFVRSKIDMKT